MKIKLINTAWPALVAAAAFILTDVRARAAELAGNVQGAGSPIAGSTVTLFAAGTGAPTQLAQGKADDSGAFNLTYGDAPADSRRMRAAVERILDWDIDQIIVGHGAVVENKGKEVFAWRFVGS